MTNSTDEKHSHVINALAEQKGTLFDKIRAEGGRDFIANEQAIPEQRGRKSVRPNPAGLRIVQECAPSGNNLSLLLLPMLGDNAPKRVRVKEDDVDRPQICMGLVGHFDPTGEIFRDGDDLTLPAHFSFLWRGQARTVLGDAVDPLWLGKADVVLPFGTLAKLQSGALQYRD